MNLNIIDADLLVGRADWIFILTFQALRPQEGVVPSPPPVYIVVELRIALQITRWRINHSTGPTGSGVLSPLSCFCS